MRIDKIDGYSAYHETKSKICFFIGYFHHVKVIFDNQDSPNAMKFYKDSILLNPKNYQAQFNLAQIYISEKNYASALKCLEYLQQS